MNSTYNGWVTNRVTGECSPQMIHSRGPRAPPVAAGITRRARVIGPPSTRKTGASIASAMWETMCRVNDTGAYHATPEQVAQITTLHPSTQDTSRMTGHVSPRRRSSR